MVSAAVLFGAVVFGGCDDAGGGDGWDDGVPVAPPHDACHLYASCGACTPVEGCGWCYDSNGAGQCASDPDFCATQEFTWTWDPSGCRVEADAGISIEPADAGAPPEADSGGGDDAEVFADDGGAGDASDDAPYPIFR